MNLNQVTIPVSNIENAIGFYQKIGLKLIVKSLPHYARFVCPNGNSTFSLHQTNEINNNDTWIYFETEDLTEKITELINLGIEILEMPSDKTWLWREAKLKDLDGNIIIIYWAGENRLNPPWRIN
jgi:catechol 2,3-dioxygenase-like lactoylglutathione lyase family enzyme